MGVERPLAFAAAAALLLARVKMPVGAAAAVLLAAIAMARTPRCG